MNKNLEHTFVLQLEENQNLIHKICRLYTNNSDEHKDLFQEITIQLWKAYPSFKGNSKFSTWMYRVGINTAITLFRKNSRRVNTTSWDQYAFKISDIEYDREEDKKISILYQAVKQLNDIEKALVFLYLEDKNYAEISEMMGITEVNARVKMNRVKSKLKKIINP